VKVVQDELIWFAIGGVALVVGLGLGAAYLLTMSGVLSLESQVLAPVKWLVDVTYRFDGWLEKITFGHKSDDA